MCKKNTNGFGYSKPSWPRFLGILLRNTKELRNFPLLVESKKKNRKMDKEIEMVGFHRFYGYFLNGEVFFIHRSLYFI